MPNDIIQSILDGICRAVSRVKISFALWCAHAKIGKDSPKGSTLSKLYEWCKNTIWKNQIVLNQWVEGNGDNWVEHVPADMRISLNKTIFDSNKYGVTHYIVGDEKTLDIPGYRILYNPTGRIIEKKNLHTHSRFLTVEVDNIAMPLICILKKDSDRVENLLSLLATQPTKLIAWINSSCDIYPMLSTERGYDGSRGVLYTFGDQLYGIDHPDNQGLFIDAERFRKGGCYDY